MKKIQSFFTIMLSVLALLVLQGCYTQFGQPQGESPEREQYEQYGDQKDEPSDEYYAEDEASYDSDYVATYEEDEEDPDRVIINKYYIYDDYADIYVDPELFDPFPYPFVSFRLSFGDPYWHYHPRYVHYPRYYRYVYFAYDPFWWDPWDWYYYSFRSPYSYGHYYYPFYYDPWVYPRYPYYGGGDFVFHDPIPNRRRDWDRRTTGVNRPGIDRRGGSGTISDNGRNGRSGHTGIDNPVERPPVIVTNRRRSDDSSGKGIADRPEPRKREVTRKQNPRKRVASPVNRRSDRRTVERERRPTTTRPATPATDRNTTNRNYENEKKEKSTERPSRPTRSRRTKVSKGEDSSGNKDGIQRKSGESRRKDRSYRNTSSRSGSKSYRGSSSRSGSSKSYRGSSSRSGSSKSSGSKSSSRSSGSSKHSSRRK